MSEWQPIETAPKGVRVLATGADDWPGLVDVGMITVGRHFWWDVDDTNVIYGQPTHWMPLPDPPHV
jgi:hypothetical protein